MYSIYGFKCALLAIKWSDHKNNLKGLQNSQPICSSNPHYTGQLSLQTLKAFSHSLSLIILEKCMYITCYTERVRGPDTRECTVQDQGGEGLGSRHPLTFDFLGLSSCALVFSSLMGPEFSLVGYLSNAHRSDSHYY